LKEKGKKKAIIIHRVVHKIMLTLIRIVRERSQCHNNSVPSISIDLFSLGSKVSSYVKSTRVKQVMADLALVHVANHGVHFLNQSEYRRLAIGIQLVCCLSERMFLRSQSPFPFQTHFLTSFLYLV